jgi:hypothetical protein
MGGVFKAFNRRQQGTAHGTLGAIALVLAYVAFVAIVVGAIR